MFESKVLLLVDPGFWKIFLSFYKLRRNIFGGLVDLLSLFSFDCDYFFDNSVAKNYLLFVEGGLLDYYFLGSNYGTADLI